MCLSVCGVNRDRLISALSAILSISFWTQRGVILCPFFVKNSACRSSLTCFSARIPLSTIHSWIPSAVKSVNNTVRSFSPLPPRINAERSSRSTSSTSMLQISETLTPVSNIIVVRGLTIGSLNSETVSLNLEISLLLRVFGRGLRLFGLLIHSGIVWPNHLNK